MASTASRAAPPPCRTRFPTQAAARHPRRLAAACFGEIVRAPPCKRRVQERSDMGLHESRRRSRVGLGLPCHLLRREDLDLSPDRLNQSGKNDHEVAGMTGFQAGVYGLRLEEHTSELQSLMRISYAVFFLKKKKYQYTISVHHH